jgi:hypothetical protein
MFILEKGMLQWPIAEESAAASMRQLVLAWGGAWEEGLVQSGTQLVGLLCLSSNS